MPADLFFCNRDAANLQPWALRFLRVGIFMVLLALSISGPLCAESRLERLRELTQAAAIGMVRLTLSDSGWTPTQCRDKAMAQLAADRSNTVKEVEQGFEEFATLLKAGESTPFDRALVYLVSEDFPAAAQDAEKAAAALAGRGSFDAELRTEEMDAWSLCAGACLLGRNFEGALVAFRKYAAYSDRTQQPVSWSEGQYLVARGLMHLQRMDEAEPILQAAIQEREKTYAAGSVETAAALAALARVRQGKNDLRSAIEIFRRAIVLRDKLVGNEDPETAILYADLAFLLVLTRDLLAAEEAIRRAKKIDEDKPGAVGPKASSIYSSLGTLQQAMGRTEEAEASMRKALEMDEKSYGLTHPDVAARLNNLSAFYIITGKMEPAQEAMQRALAILEKAHGRDSLNVASARASLGWMMHGARREKDAEDLLRSALAIEEKSHGVGHERTAATLNNLAQVLQATKRHAEAKEILERVLAIREASRGPEDATVARALSNLGPVYYETGERQKAEEVLKRAVMVGEKAFGTRDPQVATMLNNLAQFYARENRLDEAVAASRKVVGIYLDASSQAKRKHPGLEASMKNYIVVLEQKGLLKAEVDAEMESLFKEHAAGRDR